MFVLSAVWMPGRMLATLPLCDICYLSHFQSSPRENADSQLMAVPYTDTSVR